MLSPASRPYARGAAAVAGGRGGEATASGQAVPFPSSGSPQEAALLVAAARASRQSPVALLKQLRARVVGADRASLRVRHVRALYDLILFQHAPALAQAPARGDSSAADCLQAATTGPAPDMLLTLLEAAAWRTQAAADAVDGGGDGTGKSNGAATAAAATAANQTANDADRTATQLSDLSTASVVHGLHGAETKMVEAAEPQHHLPRGVEHLQLRMSTVLLLERAGQHAKAARLLECFQKVDSAHTNAPSVPSNQRREKEEKSGRSSVEADGQVQNTETAVAAARAVAFTGAQNALLLLLLLRRTRSLAARSPQELALLGHTASSARKCAPTSDPGRIETFQCRDSESRRDLFLPIQSMVEPRAQGVATGGSGLGANSGSASDTSGSSSAAGVFLNDSDPLSRRFAGTGRWHRPRGAMLGGQAGTGAAPSLFATDLFGALHRTSLLLPTNESLPRALHLHTPALPQVPDEVESLPPNSTTTSSAIIGLSDVQAPQLLARTTTAKARLRVESSASAAASGGASSLPSPGPRRQHPDASPHGPLATSWHNNIVQGMSVYQSAELHPSLPTPSDHGPNLHTAGTPQQASQQRLTLGWDTCELHHSAARQQVHERSDSDPESDETTSKAAPTTAANSPAPDSRTSRLPVSEMSQPSVRWWQRTHFTHVFSKRAVQLSDEVVCSAAIKALQGIPSGLFVASRSATSSATADSASSSLTSWQLELLPALAQLDLCTELHGANVLKTLVDKVTQYGTAFRRLGDFADYFADIAHSESTVLCAFAGFVARSLAAYQSNLVQFAEGEDAHDVLRLLAFVNRTQATLQLLWRLCFTRPTPGPSGNAAVGITRSGVHLSVTTFPNGFSFYRGAELLSYLFQFAKQSSIGSEGPGLCSAAAAAGGLDDGGGLVRTLFQVTVAPWLRMLEKWLYEGGVDRNCDPYDEFGFAHSRSAQSGMPASSSSVHAPAATASADLSLNGIHIPIFLTNADIRMVVRVGQLMRVLRAESAFAHASHCLLDVTQLRHADPRRFSGFGVQLEFGAAQSHDALFAARRIWREREESLSNLINTSRLESEAAARRDLALLVAGLRRRRRAFEEYAKQMEELQARDVAEDDLAKRLLLEELKADAANARARRYARKMQKVEEELESLRQLESLPRSVDGM